MLKYDIIKTLGLSTINNIYKINHVNPNTKTKKLLSHQLNRTTTKPNQTGNLNITGSSKLQEEHYYVVGRMGPDRERKRWADGCGDAGRRTGVIRTNPMRIISKTNNSAKQKKHDIISATFSSRKMKQQKRTTSTISRMISDPQGVTWSPPNPLPPSSCPYTASRALTLLPLPSPCLTCDLF
ncbi:hypothetical protein GWI33_018512 [Rhynchophorus ferrugineus]|uniref:Uncharacterized protein n=1 Tax=Rhynchophorus ferrugineus TaxID=354439 RepID=A0A834M2F8_RHYFE|nr:hypothetical protein GWI33_018512 [Rhynchophorus ferrugineus]